MPDHEAGRGTQTMPTYRIYFSGWVQGVGFRATCRQQARQFPRLAGQVCNLADGRVLLTVRGAAEEVAGLVNQLRDAFPRYIHGVEQAELPPGDDPLPPGLSGVQITHEP
jgi:acylphosphatase